MFAGSVIVSSAPTVRDMPANHAQERRIARINHGQTTGEDKLKRDESGRAENKGGC